MQNATAMVAPTDVCKWRLNKVKNGKNEMLNAYIVNCNGTRVLFDIPSCDIIVQKLLSNNCVYTKLTALTTINNMNTYNITIHCDINNYN